MTAAQRRELVAAGLIAAGGLGLLAVLCALNPLIAAGAVCVAAIGTGLYLAAGKE